jgi:hypothetical protein
MRADAADEDLSMAEEAFAAVVRRLQVARGLTERLLDGLRVGKVNVWPRELEQDLREVGRLVDGAIAEASDWAGDGADVDDDDF